MNIMIVGVGGQGTLLASRILGAAAQAAGYKVKLSEVHGMSQRGGSVVTYVKYGDRVDSPVIEKGEADMIIAFEELEAYRSLPYLKKDGIMVINDCKIDPMTVVIGAKTYPENIIENLKKEHTVYVIDANEEAKKLGNSKVVNVVVLGLAAKLIGFEKEDWVETIKKTVPQKTIDINVNAFNVGYNA